MNIWLSNKCLEIAFMFNSETASRRIPTYWIAMYVRVIINVSLLDKSLPSTPCVCGENWSWAHLFVVVTAIRLSRWFPTELHTGKCLNYGLSDRGKLFYYYLCLIDKIIVAKYRYHIAQCPSPGGVLSVNLNTFYSFTFFKQSVQWPSFY